MQRQNFNDRHAFAGVARGRSSQYRRPAGFHFFGFINHSNRSAPKQINCTNK